MFCRRKSFLRAFASFRRFTYDEFTAEYLRERAPPEETRMNREQEFAIMLEQFMPMIHGAVNRWNLFRDKEEYIQLGRIALFEAWEVYDPSTGDFAPLAKSYIYGRFRQELTRRERFQSRYFAMEPELLCNNESLSFNNTETAVLLRDWIATAGLTPREKDWAEAYIIDGMKPADIAVSFGVAVTTVKSWRKSTLKKLRGFSVE
jgi:RNA polymerase sigma factor (sigma-70 family)